MTPEQEALLREADNVNPPDRTIDEQRWAAQLIHDLARELRAALADAERYRWLREFKRPLFVVKPDSYEGDTMYFESELDAAIDAAREGK